MFVRFVVYSLFYGSVLLSIAAGQPDTASRKWGDWQTWGDTGDGNYTNPIVPGDYSDIDCIRVGINYYTISSTFQYSPGMIILHSTDLVNWRIAGHVVNDLTQISPEMNWDRMNRYGRGIWAGAIRYYNKKFWVYFGTPDEGYFMSTAEKPEGPWSPLHPVLKEKGWDDCCPFWDDDGQGYLIGSNFSDGYKIHLFKMTADGKGLVQGSDQVIYQSKGSEANKLYKINGTYYHFFSEVKSSGRCIMMGRSKNIYGPYEIKQLSHAQKKANEPNQGGLVQTVKGDWYFLTHHGTGDWSGRVMSLLPVNWVAGWPIIGNVGEDTIGTMVWSGKKPVSGAKRKVPASSDAFSKKKLSEQWEWNYQPRAGKWSLTERPGWLRLHAFRPLTDQLLKAGNTLTQRSMRTRNNEVLMRMDISRMADGERAGLCHFGSPTYSAIGVYCSDTGRYIELNIKGVVTQVERIDQRSLWLKSVWGLDGSSHYYYSTNGVNYKKIETPYQLAWGSYRGDRIGIYNYNSKEDKGMVDVDFFRYAYD